jgi:16S rRNA G966 N2-methylase RsmD
MQDVKLCWPRNHHKKKLSGTKKMKELPHVPKDSNLLFHSDNLVAMNYLIKTGFTGKIDLIYIDPPFCSIENYFLRRKNFSACCL